MSRRINFWEDGANVQRHVHEYIGITKLNEQNEGIHNHQFAGVTGQAVSLGDESHIHKLKTSTSFVGGHFHVMVVTTGPAIYVGNGRHIHFASSITYSVNNHNHRFCFATLIEDPSGEP